MVRSKEPIHEIHAGLAAARPKELACTLEITLLNGDPSKTVNKVVHKDKCGRAITTTCALPAFEAVVTLSGPENSIGDDFYELKPTAGSLSMSALPGSQSAEPESESNGSDEESETSSESERNSAPSLEASDTGDDDESTADSDGIGRGVLRAVESTSSAPDPLSETTAVSADETIQDESPVKEMGPTAAGGRPAVLAESESRELIMARKMTAERKKGPQTGLKNPNVTTDPVSLKIRRQDERAIQEWCFFTSDPDSNDPDDSLYLNDSYEEHLDCPADEVTESTASGLGLSTAEEGNLSDQ